MQNNPEKKLYIMTLGCAMNVRDSEHLLGQLQHEYTPTEDEKDADLIIINTCSVREKPVKKLFSEIGKLVKVKKPQAKVGVCGCTASHLGSQIIKRAPAVDFVLGARNVSKINEALGTKGYVATDINHDESGFSFEKPYVSNPYKRMVNISIGCDKQCSFCIVPNTRGSEISVPPELIKKEITQSVAEGVKEVMLLGQNVNNYGRRFSGSGEKTDFTGLLRDISRIEGLERIRFTSPHPLHMDDAFLQEFAANPKICKSIHMPLQSGSTAVLKDMKRGYSKEWFLNRVRRLKELVPEVTVGTDIIVGFPGESEEDFEHTLDVVRQVGFDQVFSFKYSPRPLTAAQDFENPVDDATASYRLATLQRLCTQIIDEKMQSYRGKTVRVYFEQLQGGGRVAGRSDTNVLVSVNGSEELLGRFADVTVTRAHRMSLDGELA